MNVMLCSSCGKQKDKYFTRKSKLLTGMTLYLCQACKDSNMEPRYVIVLYGRANGIDSITEYVRMHRYMGREITATELCS